MLQNSLPPMNVNEERTVVKYKCRYIQLNGNLGDIPDQNLPHQVW